MKVVLLGARKVGKTAWLTMFKSLYGQSILDTTLNNFSNNFQKSSMDETLTISSTILNTFISNTISFIDVQQEDFDEVFLNDAEIVILFYNIMDPESLKPFFSFATKIQLHNETCDKHNLALKIKKIIIIGTKADQNIAIKNSDIESKKNLILKITNITPMHFRMSVQNPNPSNNEYYSFKKFHEVLNNQIAELTQEKIKMWEAEEEKKSKLTQPDEYTKKKYNSHISTLSDEEHFTDGSYSSSISSEMHNIMDLEQAHNKLSIMTPIAEKQDNDSINSTGSSGVNTHSCDTNDRTESTLTGENTSDLTLSKDKGIKDDKVNEYVNVIRKHAGASSSKEIQRGFCFSYCYYCFCWGLFWSGLFSAIFTVCGIVAGLLDKYDAIKGFHVPKKIFHLSFADWSPLWRGAVMGAVGGGIVGTSGFILYLTYKCLCSKKDKGDHARDTTYETRFNRLAIPVIKGQLSSL